MTKLQWIDEEIAGLKAAGLYNHIRPIDSPMGATRIGAGNRSMMPIALSTSI